MYHKSPESVLFSGSFWLRKTTQPKQKIITISSANACTMFILAPPQLMNPKARNSRSSFHHTVLNTQGQHLWWLSVLVTFYSSFPLFGFLVLATNALILAEYFNIDCRVFSLISFVLLNFPCFISYLLQSLYHV